MKINKRGINMDTINELMQETKSNKVGGELITKELFFIM